MSNIPRRASRVNTSIEVRWGFTKDCPYTGTIINLTVLGCAVQIGGRTKVQAGQVVLIRFWRPRKRILKVEVIHNSLKDVKGFGAKFLDLNEEEKDTLEQLVQLFGEPEPANTPESANNPETANNPDR
jgi:hypothetical protein